MKFSELIEELTEMWLLWMKHNAIVADQNLSISERKESSDECERLIDKEYEIAEKLDSFFIIAKDTKNTNEKKRNRKHN